MAPSAPVLLHVGLSKTATTALQAHVFTNLPGARSIGKPEPPKPLKKALRRVIAESPRVFSPATLAVVSDHLRARDRRTVILSHEGLTATRHEMRDDDRFLRVTGFRTHRSLVAQRLSEACGDAGAQVLFSVREQCSWLVSLYGDLVQREALATPFEEWVERGLEDPESFVGDPDYSWLIGVYAERFGHENVHVVAYEDLHKAPQRFAARLAAAGRLDEGELRSRIASLPRVKGSEDLPEIAAARVSRHSKDRHDPARVLPPIPREIPAALAQKVQDFCRAGNRWIEERYGAPLAEHGYAS